MMCFVRNHTMNQHQRGEGKVIKNKKVELSRRRSSSGIVACLVLTDANGAFRFQYVNVNRQNIR